MPSASLDISAKCCMEAQKEYCAFCADSDTQRRRHTLSAILCRVGPLCALLRTVWPALWRQLLTTTRKSIDYIREVHEADTFPTAVGKETNASFPCRNVVITSTWLMVGSSYPASLPTSSITLRKHCGSTENPNKGTFIVLHTRTEVHACDYM